MLNNKPSLSQMAAALLVTGKGAQPSQSFTFEKPPFMPDFTRPDAPKPPPPPLEESDPELAELIQWFEKQPKSIRRKLEVVRVENKVGRNDPCPCGSNKKYKKCCLQ